MSSAATEMNSTVQSLGSEERFLWTLIGITLIIKLLFAIFLPLGVDENYAIAVAREFTWSFFDHPPIGFWSPVIAANLTGLDVNFVYRIPFLLFGLGTTYAVYKIAEGMKDATAGLWAAFLYSVAPFFVFGGGVMAIPDGPIGFGSAMSVMYLLKIARADGKETVGQWMLAGAWLGFALASKYQSGLIPISALLFVLVSPVGRSWFSRPGLYIGSAIGLLGLAPVLIWNLQNEWVSFAFHSGRTDGQFNLESFGFLAVVQAIYLLPTVFLASFAGLGYAFGERHRPDVLLLGLIALGPILMFNYIYLFSHASFAHWAMPGWLFTLPLAGVWLSEKSMSFRRGFRWTSVLLASLMLVILTTLVLHMKYGVITRFIYEVDPRDDRTVDSFDWSGLESELNRRGLLENTDIIVARNWYEGGEMSTALNGKYPMKIAGTEGHHFDYMSGANIKGTGLMLAPETLALYEERKSSMFSSAQNLDQNAKMLEPIILERGGVPYAAVMVVQLQIR